MTKRVSRIPRDFGFPVYLIPVLVGISGVMFSQQLGHPGLRLAVVLLSLTVAVFSAGMVLGKLQSQGTEKLWVLAGVGLLTLGALLTASGLFESLVRWNEVPGGLLSFFRGLGMASLFIGLVAMLVLLIRRGEIAEEIAARLSSLAEHMGDGFILSSPEGRVVMVNNRLLEMTGLQRDEIVGREGIELIRRFGTPELLQDFLDGRRTNTFEFGLPWERAGETCHYWVSGHPIFDRNGAHAGTLITVRDITEQQRLSKRLERYTQGLQKLVEEKTRQLRLSETRLRDLLLHMNDGFLTLDPEYRIQFVNNRVCELIGLDAQQLRGRDVFDFVLPVDKAILHRLCKEASEKKDQDSQEELNLVNHKGEVIPVMTGAAAMVELPEEQLTYSLVTTNIAPLKEMQNQLEKRAEELQHANEELRKLDRSKDTFLSNVTHELQTPLSTIRGYIEMIESGDLGEVPAAMKNALRVMERNAARLSTLIDEMLEFSRMEILGMRLSMGLVRVDRVVEECVSSARPQMEAKRIACKLEPAADCPMIWGDKTRIGQLLTILLSNAIKFTGEGGTITVSTALVGDTGIRLSVADTGIGIPPEMQQRVFDKFVQADSSLNRRYQGAGIGLSIAKNIAEAHGGYIELESVVGEGSVFSFNMPHSVFRPEAPGVERTALQGMRILVVDEDAECRTALGQFVSACGGFAVEAANGHEAARLAGEMMPDAILIDETVQEMSGKAVVQRLNDSPETAGIPAVLLTGSQDNQLVQPGDAPFTRVKKPITPADLSQVLEAVCSGDPMDRPSPLQAVASNDQPQRFPVVVWDSDPDFLEWVHAALQSRGIEAKVTPDLNEARSCVDNQCTKSVFLEWSHENERNLRGFDRTVQAVEKRGARLIYMTALPSGVESKYDKAHILQKPFGVRELLECVELDRDDGRVELG